MADTVIEPVRRSFAVLEALSRRRSTTLAVLTAETGLTRPTAVRFLHTLIALICTMGRALLAFSSVEERRAALAAMGGSSARQSAAVDLQLDRIRRTGWAFTAQSRPTRLHGIAVPVRNGTRVLDSVSMRFVRSAMTEEAAGQRFGKRLQALARAIVGDVAHAPSA
jgi:DNA-binding IclR family transcriptional regulator